MRELKWDSHPAHPTQAGARYHRRNQRLNQLCRVLGTERGTNGDRNLWRMRFAIARSPGPRLRRDHAAVQNASAKLVSRRLAPIQTIQRRLSKASALIGVLDPFDFLGERAPRDRVHRGRVASGGVIAGKLSDTHSWGHSWRRYENRKLALFLRCKRRVQPCVDSSDRRIRVSTTSRVARDGRFSVLVMRLTVRAAVGLFPHRAALFSFQSSTPKELKPMAKKPTTLTANRRLRYCSKWQST